MDAKSTKALEGALTELGVPAEEITENPTKAGMNWLFKRHSPGGSLSPATYDPLPTPSKDENAS